MIKAVSVLLLCFVVVEHCPKETLSHSALYYKMFWSELTIKLLNLEMVSVTKMSQQHRAFWERYPVTVCLVEECKCTKARLELTVSQDSLRIQWEETLLQPWPQEKRGPSFCGTECKICPFTQEHSGPYPTMQRVKQKSAVHIQKYLRPVLSQTVEVEVIRKVRTL